MKTTILFTGLLFFSALTYAQDIDVSNVPSVVLNSFNKNFPTATDVEWERKGELFNVEFDVKFRDHEAWLNSKGGIVKHKKQLKAGELPVAVANTIKQNFKGYRIDDVDQYEERKQFFYKVELKNYGEERNLVFDQKGKQVDVRL